MVHLPRVSAFPIMGEKNVITLSSHVLVLPSKEKRSALIGQMAPDFELPDHEGRRVSLHETIKLGRPIILFFFPLAGSPHCTRESCLFRDGIGGTPVFADMDAIVIGVSQDPPDRSKRFVEELSLQYRVLYDEARHAMDTYGVGRALGGLIDNRTTFVIDASGIVRGMAVGVWDAKGHFRFAEKWLVRLEHEYSGRTRHVEEYERDEDDRSAVGAGRVARVTYGPEGSAPTGGVGGTPRYGVAGNVRSRAISNDGRERIRPSTSKGALGSPQSTPHTPSPRSAGSAGRNGSAGRAGWKGLIGQLSSDDNQPPPLATASVHASPSQKTSSDQASIRSKSSGRRRFGLFARKPPPIPPTYQDLDNADDVEFGEVDPAAETEEDAIPAVPSLDHSTWSAVTSTDSSLGGPAPRAPNMTNEVILANAKGWTQVPLSNGSHGAAPDSSSSNGSWSKAGSPAAASHSSLPTASSGAPVLPASVPSSPLRGLGFSVGARAPQTPSSSPGSARQRLPSFGSKNRSALSSSSVDEPLPPPPIAKSPPPPQAPRDVPTDVGEEEHLAPAFQELPRRRPATAASSSGPVSPLISALSHASLKQAAIASARREGRTSERPAHEYSPVRPSKYEPREEAWTSSGGRILEGPRVPMRESSRPSTAPQPGPTDPQAFVSPLFAPLRQRQDENRRAAAAAAPATEADAAAPAASAMQRSSSASTSGYQTPRNSSMMNKATGAQTPRSASSHTSGVHTPEGLARSGSGKADSIRSQPMTPSMSSPGEQGAQPVSLSPIVDAPNGEWDDNAAIRAISPRPSASRKGHAKLPPAPPAPTAALPAPPSLSALATSVAEHGSPESDQGHPFASHANSIFSTSPSDSHASATPDFHRRPSVASVRSTGTFG